MTSSTEGRYLFPHSWEGEGERLAGIAAAFDPITIRHLAGRGVGGGWRCLEVGAGTGTIARWLSDEVGPKGRVLATDISLKLMEGLEAGNLEIRQHDILTDPLPDEEFDLVHCRLVLEHLPGRLDALARMARGLAPGGWLVIEDVTLGTQTAAGRRGAVAIGGLLRGLSVLMRRNGYDGGFGRRLPIHLARLGLADVGAEGTQLVLIGGSPSVAWARPTLGRLRDMLVDGESEVWPAPVRKVTGRPAVRRVLERRLDGLDDLLADPEFVYLAPTFVSAWARRPPETDA
jgi:SAM-dependent methyltransferase